MSLEFPKALRELARGEDRPLDEALLVAHLARAGVQELAPYPGQGFRGLDMVASGMPFRIDNIWVDSSSPVADALDDAIRVARDYDLLRRLHSAWMDMDQILHAARALLPAKERRFDDELHAFSGPLEEVIETGMVTMYARHFTGERALPGRWWPRGKRKAVHDWLIAYRHAVVAHADETTARQLVALETVGPGPPVVAIGEARRHMEAADLVELIHHCERMYARYSDAVLKLKWGLGIAASGEILGASDYDE